jgi:hypothetical protein
MSDICANSAMRERRQPNGDHPLRVRGLAHGSARRARATTCACGSRRRRAEAYSSSATAPYESQNPASAAPRGRNASTTASAHSHTIAAVPGGRSTRRGGHGEHRERAHRGHLGACQQRVRPGAATPTAAAILRAGMRDVSRTQRRASANARPPAKVANTVTCSPRC